MVQGQPREKVHETAFQPMSGHGGTSLSSQLHWEAQLEDLHPGQPQHKVRTCLKNNQCKKGLMEWLMW
jgi:hypothetical protein